MIDTLPIVNLPGESTADAIARLCRDGWSVEFAPYGCGARGVEITLTKTFEGAPNAYNLRHMVVVDGTLGMTMQRLASEVLGPPAKGARCVL